MDAEDYEKGQGEMWEHSSGGRSSRSKGEQSSVPELVKGVSEETRGQGPPAVWPTPHSLPPLLRIKYWKEIWGHTLKHLECSSQDVNFISSLASRRNFTIFRMNTCNGPS